MKNLAGLKTLGRLRELFAHLHDHGCARDRAGNRTLHLDDLACLVMVALFNPVARGLRALSQVSDLDQVRKRLGVKHVSLGSMSEAARLFDPEVRPDRITRLVMVRCEPHQKRGGRKGKTAGPSSGGELLLATNLLDVPAEIIGLIYLYRLSIEIFFRVFKQTLGCRHLLWEHPKGILLETYRAWIACLLINQSTGRKPTRRAYEMLCYFVMGLASQDEVMTRLAKAAAEEAAKKAR